MLESVASLATDPKVVFGSLYKSIKYNNDLSNFGSVVIPSTAMLGSAVQFGQMGKISKHKICHFLKMLIVLI